MFTITRSTIQTSIDISEYASEIVTFDYLSDEMILVCAFTSGDLFSIETSTKNVSIVDFI